MARRCLYVTLSETADRAERSGDVARLVAGGHRGLRARAARHARTRRTVHALPSLGNRARRDGRSRCSRSWTASARARVVFDSLSEMRLLARDPLRYRRQILALKEYFSGRDCTVLMLDDHTSGRQRPSAAEHRARRRPARAAAVRVRRDPAGGFASSSSAAWRARRAITTSRFSAADWSSFHSCCRRAPARESLESSRAESPSSTRSLAAD